ncbi:MAG: hypothetical protein ACI4KA_07980, partial [Oscillospiraceae bacterium]
EKYGWEFLFLGANIDAIATAKSFGISADRAVEFTNDSRGTRLNYETVSNAVSMFRSCEAVGAEWKKAIEEDHANRR